MVEVGDGIGVRPNRLCVVWMQESEGGAEAPQAPLQTGKASKKATGKAGAGHKAGAGPGAGAAAAKADRAAEQQRQAELELLMMDDSALQDVARVGERKPSAVASVFSTALQAAHMVA